jgi:predicted DNA-binding ribbon-helix-helix protein
MVVTSIRLEDRVVTEIEKIAPEGNISLWIRMLVTERLKELGKITE